MIAGAGLRPAPAEKIRVQIKRFSYKEYFTGRKKV
jgi:hypothetical protein